MPKIPDNRYILVCDAGSTKTQAALYDSQSRRVTANETMPGVNPVHEDEETILRSFARLQSMAPEDTAVLYFGTGCLPGKPTQRIRNCFERMGLADNIRIESDLEGACIALLGDKPGIACILGTGSNSALWDGERIVQNVAPLGYVLGDEGSGTALGKQLVRSVLRGQVSDALRDRFFEQTKYDRQSIIESVYRKEGANRFLSSLAYFLSHELELGEVQQLVVRTFDVFFTDILGCYPDSRRQTLAFTGSISKIFEQQLTESARSHGYEIAKIFSSPMPGIIDYLKNKTK